VMNSAVFFHSSGLDSAVGGPRPGP